MAKQSKLPSTPAALKKHCDALWSDTFIFIKEDCASTLKMHQADQADLKADLQHQKAELRACEQTVRSLTQALQKKENKTQKNKCDRAKTKSKAIKKTIASLEKQIEKKQAIILDVKTIQAEQKAKIMACRAFKVKEVSSVKPKPAEPIKTDSSQPLLQVGDIAPAFRAISDNEQPIELSDYRGRYVVLYFYPKDNTPGCTQQAIDFTDCKSQFDEKNAVIFGVSRDTVSSHERFKTKHDLDVVLLSDVDEAICQRYDVIKAKVMYGKPARGIERSTFLINPEGKIQQIWRNVKVPGHVSTVLGVLNN